MHSRVTHAKPHQDLAATGPVVVTQLVDPSAVATTKMHRVMFVRYAYLHELCGKVPKDREVGRMMWVGTTVVLHRGYQRHNRPAITTTPIDTRENVAVVSIKEAI
eukprot:COSAG02_NODE_2241_length_9405_cov_7.458951_3_plen_105_part_00